MARSGQKSPEVRGCRHALADGNAGSGSLPSPIGLHIDVHASRTHEARSRLPLEVPRLGGVIAGGHDHRARGEPVRRGRGRSFSPQRFGDRVHGTEGASRRSCARLPAHCPRPRGRCHVVGWVSEQLDPTLTSQLSVEREELTTWGAPPLAKNQIVRQTGFADEVLLERLLHELQLLDEHALRTQQA
jgi:hypothetical protein